MWQTLVELDGFVTPDDPRIKAVEDAFDGALKRVVGLGGYATPIDADELENGA